MENDKHRTPFPRSYWVSHPHLLAGFYPDVDVPTPEHMETILDAIDKAISAGTPVYVHCWGGRGRTGTVVGCWLARHGIATGDAALERIAALRAGVPKAQLPSPETEPQRAMVRGWKEDAQ